MLDRIPELQILADHPRVARALASGKPHKLYRVLWWGRILGWFRDHQQLVDSLLAQRRLFLEPIGSAPSLYTLNGIGTRIYGHDDIDPQDGTGIGTLFFTFLFLPIVPIRQYLVTSEGRSYSFFGKIPFGSATYLWRQLLTIGVTIGIAATAYTTWERYRHNDLIVVNGLSTPVIAVVGDRQLDIPAFGRTTQRLDTGAYTIAITGSGGEMLEEGEIEISSGPDVVAWNVLGSAPLYEERIAYSLEGTEPGNAPEPQIYCGQSQIVRNKVDFPFRKPPTSIDLPSGQSVVWRSHFDVANGGWLTCVSLLMMQEKFAQAATLAGSAVDVDSAGEIAVLQAAMMAAGQEGEFLQWLEAKLQSQDVVELHRARQDILRRKGRVDEIRRDYLARYRAAPDSADAAYLWVRTLPRADALRELPALRERWPDHPYLIRSDAWHLHGSLRFSESLPLWEQLADEEGIFEERLEALVALDRADEALSLMQQQPVHSFDDAVLRAQVAVAAGQSPDPATVAELTEDPAYARALLLARTSGEVSSAQLEAISDPELRSVVEVTVALHDDCARALDMLRSAGIDLINQLDTDSGILLLGEAENASDDELADRIAERLPAMGFYGDAIALIQGRAGADLLEELPIHLRSMVELTMSRRPGLSRTAVARLRSAARRDDVWHLVVTHALDRWPS